MRSIVLTAVSVLVLVMAWGQPAAAQDRARPPARRPAAGRDADEPSVNAKQLRDMVAEARRLGMEASTLRNEAVAGRVRDRSQSTVGPDGQPGEVKWIELTDEERIDRFNGAKARFAESFKKIKDVQDFVKKHPNLIPDSAPANATKFLSDQYAVTLAAEANFRMQKKLGTISDWQRLADEALKYNKDNIEAQRLSQKLKEMAEKQKEEEGRAKAEGAAEKKTPGEKKPEKKGDGKSD